MPVVRRPGVLLKERGIREAAALEILHLVRFARPHAKDPTHGTEYVNISDPAYMWLIPLDFQTEP